VCIQHLETQNYTTTNQHEKTPAPSRKRKPRASLMLATTIHESNTTPHHQVERKQTHHHPHTRGWHTPTGFPNRGRSESGPVASKPNSVLGSPHRTRHPPDHSKKDVQPAGFLSSFDIPLHQNPIHYRPRPSNESPRSPNPHTTWAGHGSRGAP